MFISLVETIAVCCLNTRTRLLYSDADVVLLPLHLSRSCGCDRQSWFDYNFTVRSMKFKHKVDKHSSVDSAGKRCATLIGVGPARWPVTQLVLLLIVGCFYTVIVDPI